MTRDEAKKWIEGTCGKGWLPLLDKAFDNLPPGLKIVEVFQKYGKLEFRLDAKNDPFEFYLYDISFESALICEVCGGFGSEEIVDGWVVTLCKQHFLEQSGKS